MSRKLSDIANLPDEFKDMTLKEFFEYIQGKQEEMFWKAYGRYESPSGKMFIELEHDGDEDHTKGLVKWRKGIVGKPELEENLSLNRKSAIAKFSAVIRKGYRLVFQAVTPQEFQQKNEVEFSKKSESAKKGLLGSYYKGGNFFRINQYTDNIFIVEEGLDGFLTKVHSNLTEDEANKMLNSALIKGFRREGEQLKTKASTFIDVWNETATNDSADEEKTVRAGQFDYSLFED